MPKLLINESGQASVFELFEDEATIGRGASNAIQVVDAHASKNHAVIRRLGGRLKLVDLESKNGTRVNGEFRNQRWLAHGDAIAIGAAVLTYDGTGDAPVAPSRPGAARVSVGGGLSAPATAAVATAPAAQAYAPTATRPSGVRAGARRARDDDDEDGEPRRRLAPKKSGAPMALLMGGIALALVGVMILIFSGSPPKNANALREAKRIRATGQVKQALDYLLANGDPSNVDTYKSVQDQINTYKAELADQGANQREDASNAAYKQLYKQYVEWYKTGRPIEEFGDLILAYTTEYAGTLQVKALLHVEHEPFPKLRALLQKAKDKANKGG